MNAPATFPAPSPARDDGFPVSLWVMENRDASGAVYMRQTFWHNPGATEREALAYLGERWPQICHWNGAPPATASVTRLYDNVPHADAMLRAGEEHTFTGNRNYGGLLS